MLVDNRGIVLSDVVDLNFLKELEPQYFTEYIKFVVDLETKEVAVGMQLHASNLLLGNPDNYRGGNIFFEDGHIEYESTLNQKINLSIRKKNKDKDFHVNPRIITDKNLIEEINLILFELVKI